MHTGAAARYNNYAFHLACCTPRISPRTRPASHAALREKIARSLDFVCRADTDTSERHLERHRAVAARSRAQTRDGTIFIKKSPLPTPPRARCSGDPCNPHKRIRQRAREPVTECRLNGARTEWAAGGLLSWKFFNKVRRRPEWTGRRRRDARAVHVPRRACCVSADYSEIARESRPAGSDATLVNDDDRGKNGDARGRCRIRTGEIKRAILRRNRTKWRVNL